MQAKAKTFLSIILSFLLGGAAGGFIGSAYFAKHTSYRNRPTREAVGKEFATKLQLTEIQSVSVDSLIEANRTKFSTLSKQYSASFKANRDSLRASIRKLVTPEQNMLYDQYIREMEEREKKWRQDTR
ncbi:MAG: hypothetical protein ACRDGA_14615 [Bacteroidota bacterium]